jgi:hypothetical protein
MSVFHTADGELVGDNKRDEKDTHITKVRNPSIRDDGEERFRGQRLKNIVTLRATPAPQSDSLRTPSHFRPPNVSSRLMPRKEPFPRNVGGKSDLAVTVSIFRAQNRDITHRPDMTLKIQDVDHECPTNTYDNT